MLVIGILLGDIMGLHQFLVVLLVLAVTLLHLAIAKNIIDE